MIRKDQQAKGKILTVGTKCDLTENPVQFDIG